MWKINSPDGNIVVTIRGSQNSALTYYIENRGMFSGKGDLGICTNLAEFGTDLTYVERIDQVIDETYSIPVGKKDIYENKANESRLLFKKEGFPFALIVRAYDNGVAFRYAIQMEEKEFELKVNRELTSFEFDDSFDQIWLQDWVATYEAPYNKTTWCEENHARHFGMPVLIHSKEKQLWIMLNEANVLNANGSYCVSHVKGTSECCLTLEFAPEEKGQPIHSTLPFQSPWRYLLIETNLNSLVNATLNYNLNPPSIVEDVSWIKPSRAVWAWWSSDMGAASFTEAKQYVDFAVAMGFEAVVLDDDWDITWIKTFCDYAHEHKVQPWLWSAMQTIDTYEKASHLLSLWKSWGIVGVKIDIFENDSAHTASQYQMMAEIMKDLQLMVNFHGNNKPGGEGRTWPHFVTAEGIMGLEYYKWSDLPCAKHNCTVPFIRNAAGPMDYTPVGFHNKNRNTSMAHQMALAAVFESGSTHYASSIFHLEPWKGTAFLRRLKPKYDGLKLLSGFPGDHTAMLRWVNASEEYIIGCICNHKRTLRLQFDFLPDGEFEAEVYCDDRFGEQIVFEKIVITKESFLDISMVEHGGAGIYIARKIIPLHSDKHHNYMKLPFAEVQGVQLRPFLGSEISELSEGQQGISLKGGGAFLCHMIPASKRYTFRITYCANEWFKLQISDGKSTVNKKLPPSGAGTVFSVADMVLALDEGPCNIMLTLLYGKAPFISKVSIIDNISSNVMRLPVEIGEIWGGGALVQDDSGDYTLVGMPKNSVLRYPSVMMPTEGTYLVRINYEAGITGESRIRINNHQSICAHLSGVNLFRIAKVGDIIVREVMVHLLEGMNDIELVADSSLPPILNLEIIKEF